MKFTGRRKTGSSILNLTPLIDCMFLLVIFIMIAARFEPDSGIAVDLPSASSGAAREEKPKHISLTVTEDGRIFVEQDEVAIDALEDRIVAARTALGDPEGKDVILVVYGDTDASHGMIVRALDAAARVKQQKVTIRTRE
jgi:biopolymer transport protein ExbD